MEVNIRYEHNHYTVYINGEFYCKTNTHIEAAMEAERITNL